MVQQEPGQGCKYHCFTGKNLRLRGSRSDVSAALWWAVALLIDMWDTFKKSISTFSWGRVSPCHSCNRPWAAVSSRGPLWKMLGIPGRARDSQLWFLPSCWNYGYEQQQPSVTRTFFALHVLVFNSGRLWLFWHLIYIFCKTSSYNTEGRQTSQAGVLEMKRKSYLSKVECKCTHW